MQLAVRVPRSMVESLDRLVPDRHPTRAAAIRAAVEQYLYRLACDEDARRYAADPLTPEELALTEDADAWRTAPPW